MCMQNASRVMIDNVNYKRHMIHIKSKYDFFIYVHMSSTCLWEIHYMYTWVIVGSL